MFILHRCSVYPVLVLLQENRPVGTSVLQLTVTDRDATHNGPPFTFSIVAGNEDSAFQVNPQGELLAAAALSRQAKDHYLLQIQVSLGHHAAEATTTSH